MNQVFHKITEPILCVLYWYEALDVSNTIAGVKRLEVKWAFTGNLLVCKENNYFLFSTFIKQPLNFFKYQLNNPDDSFKKE